MRILLTGCAGFIGSHVAEALLAQGHTVIGVDNFDAFYPRSIKESNLRVARASVSFSLYEVDIRDVDGLRKVFASAPPDIVLHFAAKAGVRPSIEDPGAYFDVNVKGTLHILELMREFHVRRLVFASSSSVYGNGNVPFHESQDVSSPISPYAASKRAAEMLCFTYHHLFGLDIHCLRFFTVFGPRQRPEMAITKFTRAILAGDEIELFAEGRSSRDYTFIADIVQGVLASVHTVGGYEIINLGESTPIVLIDLLHALETATGRKARYRLLPQQPGDVETTYAAIDKAKTLLGYQPKFPVPEGLKLFVRWYQEEVVRAGTDRRIRQ